MKRTILAASLSLMCGFVVNAQTSSTQANGQASNQTSATANARDKSINLDSGTRLTSELQSTLDARNAKVGDQVVLRTTSAIKSHGHTVVNKGSRLIGHVTEVARNTKNNGESRIGLLFDRLQGGSLNVPITATITSVTNAAAHVSAADEDLFATSNSTMSSSGAGVSRSSSGSSGGLVGGVVNSTTSTAGNIVGGTTAAVGSTVSSTTGVVSNTAGGVGRSLGGIQISESSDTSLAGSSVLALQGKNLRLEKGTTFNVVLTQSASAGTTRQ